MVLLCFRDKLIGFIIFLTLKKWVICETVIQAAVCLVLIYMLLSTKLRKSKTNSVCESNQLHYPVYSSQHSPKPNCQECVFCVIFFLTKYIDVNIETILDG